MEVGENKNESRWK